jgi:hypothetical protein
LFAGVPPGEYLLVATVGRTGSADALWATEPVRLSPGERQTGIDLTLERAASVSGTVRLIGDGAWTPLTVTLESSDTSGVGRFARNITAVDRNGRFAVAGLPAGEYTIRVASATSSYVIRARCEINHRV